MYSTCKENGVHIPGRPSGIANPSLLHQAHEQRDFSPYMAVGCTQQLHVTLNSGVPNVNTYNWELSLCTFTDKGYNEQNVPLVNSEEKRDFPFSFKESISHEAKRT